MDLRAPDVRAGEFFYPFTWDDNLLQALVCAAIILFVYKSVKRNG